ncbi:Flp pilus assembly protein CpaB [Spongisporangium articulatum]|uniref:Flp pilus assembly protein CpaB n=1 Tax=Spongisporangium articulatum TaxID=3362603 RepID=A0ABW8AIA3_9ACTN
MSRRVLTVLAAGTVFLLGVVLVVAYARGADRRALAGQQAVSVYVAVDDVPAGTSAASAAAQGLIRRELVARLGVPDGALGEIGPDYGQRVATSAIPAGELVLRERFSVPGTTPGGLAVPEGMVAVSVALTDPSHVGSFVTVGARVAVYDTYNVLGSGNRTPAGDHLAERHEYRRATRVLLPDVEVLAVGTSSTTVAADGAPDAAAPDAAAQQQPADATTLFTLAVSPADARRLVHVTLTGTLTFALLGPRADVGSGTGADDAVDDGSLFREAS